MVEKIEIGYAKKRDIDFGNLREDYRDGTIKVDKEAWFMYVKKRTEFEQMHRALMDSLPKKYAEMMNVCPICGELISIHSTGQTLVCNNILTGEMAGV